MKLNQSLLSLVTGQGKGQSSQDYFEEEQGRASPCQTSRLRKLQVIKIVISINDSIQVASVKHPRFRAKEEVELEQGLEGSLRNIERLTP